MFRFFVITAATVLVGCSPSTPTRQPVRPAIPAVPLEYDAEDDAAEFIDHIERYDGKRVTLKLVPESSNIGVRDRAGGWENFRHNNPAFKICIAIPKDLEDVPNAVFPDEVMVTFVCRGTRERNICHTAVAIKRARN